MLQRHAREAGQGRFPRTVDYLGLHALDHGELAKPHRAAGRVRVFRVFVVAVPVSAGGYGAVVTQQQNPFHASINRELNRPLAAVVRPVWHCVLVDPVARICRLVTRPKLSRYIDQVLIVIPPA